MDDTLALTSLAASWNDTADLGDDTIPSLSAAQHRVLDVTAVGLPVQPEDHQTNDGLAPKDDRHVSLKLDPPTSP